MRAMGMLDVDKVLWVSAYGVLRGNTAHHGQPVREFIFLFEGMAFGWKIVYLYFLGVNLPWLLALGCSPLREKSNRGQGYAGKDARGHEEGWQPSLGGSTCSESRTCLYTSHSVAVPPSALEASLGHVGLAHCVE
jgi:hypothetical protein